MAQSVTKTINTQGIFETVESLTGITFVNGNTYTIQIVDVGYLKIGDAVFEMRNQIMQYKAGADTLYIKTDFIPCKIAILEEESA